MRIALPVGPHLDPSDMKYISSTLRQVLNEVRP